MLLFGGNEVHDPHRLQLTHYLHHSDAVQVAFRNVSLVLFPKVLHKIRMAEVLLSFSDGEENHLRNEEGEKVVFGRDERIEPS